MKQLCHDHERKDADVISLFMIVIMLAVMCMLIVLAVGGMIHYFKLKEPAKTAGQANIPVTRAAEFPAPRLEIKPGSNLTELRAAEDANLNSYGWEDRKTGTVRIPIDRAVELILERGLPDVGAGQTPLSLIQARPNETESPSRLMQK